MVDFEKQFGRPDYALDSKVGVASIFRQVYGWMFVGLAISGAVAWFTATSELCLHVLSGPGFMVCIIAEFGLVIALSAAINKLPPAVACLMFLLYAAVNGLTLSAVFLVYDLGLVYNVFFITAAMFGGLALWGTCTRGDLSGIGSVCFMGLLGLIIASIVNIFLKSSGLDWIVSFAGVIIFSGLTMYDAQKVKQLAANASMMDSATAFKCGILGALELYLDFINLFLYILKFFGRKR